MGVLSELRQWRNESKLTTSINALSLPNENQTVNQLFYLLWQNCPTATSHVVKIFAAKISNTISHILHSPNSRCRGSTSFAWPLSHRQVQHLQLRFPPFLLSSSSRGALSLSETDPLPVPWIPPSMSFRGIIFSLISQFLYL